MIGLLPDVPNNRQRYSNGMHAIVVAAIVELPSTKYQVLLLKYPPNWRELCIRYIETVAYMHVMHAASMCENKFLYKSLHILCCQCVLQPQFTLFQLWSHLPSTGPICENFQRNVWEDTCDLDDVANAAFNLHLHCGPHQIATSLCRDALILSMALTATQHNYYLHQMNIDDLNRSMKFKFNRTITHIKNDPSTI